MPRIRTEVILFMSSFSPLLIVFALLDTFMSGWVNYVVLIGLAVASNIGLALFFKYAQKRKADEVVVKEASKRDGDAIGYFATYILPFAALAVTNWQQRLAIVVVLLVVGCLYVRAHLFYINPVLALAGFQLFDIDIESRTMIVISKRRFIPKDSKMDLVSLNDYIFLEKSDAS
jgi:hypothetical protein